MDPVSVYQVKISPRLRKGRTSFAVLSEADSLCDDLREQLPRPAAGTHGLTPEQVLLTKPNRVVVERDRGSGGH